VHLRLQELQLLMKLYGDCRSLWLRGLCPCCGHQVDETDVVIGEGVRLCIMCAMRGHHQDELHVQRLLEAIASG